MPETREDPPRVSIIIPVRNGGGALRQCLRGVAANKPEPLETLIVLDGEPAESERLAEKPDARIIQLPERRGPAGARNAGARAAAGDILFFVDADVVLPPDAVARVARAFAEDPGLTALFGSYDAAPAEPNFLSQFKNLVHHYVHQAAREEASTFWGACGAVRRAPFLALGGFDETYREPCVEDIELGYRLTRAGHRIRLCKELQAKHLKRWTPASLLRTDFLRRALPWTELILLHPELANDLNLRPASRLSVLAAWGLVASLAGAWWWHWLLAPAAALAAALLALNARLYLFLRCRRGTWFALEAVPWHWFYYLYGGLAFAIGLARHLLGRRRPLWTGQQGLGNRPDTHAGMERS